MPTPEQLAAFQTTYDGEERPDLIPFALKVREAVSAYDSVERLKIVFTPRDHELTDAFHSASQIAAQEDAQVTNAMYQDLCERIDALDGESAAAAVAEMDEVIRERRDARARTYVESLTPEAGQAVLSEAGKQVRRIKGASNNLVAMARQHPEFVKQRVRETCVRLSLRPK